LVGRIKNTELNEEFLKKKRIVVSVDRAKEDLKIVLNYE